LIVTASDGPVRGVTDEHTLLSGFLDHERRAAVTTLAGVPAGLLREPLVLPDGSLLALVQHLTYLERWWFTHTFAGIPAQFPWTSADPLADWRLDRLEPPAAIVRSYRDECTRSRRLVQRASLDQAAVRTTAAGEPVTLRSIFLHMIVETARHNGHADLLRSLIDGASQPPPCPWPRPAGQ
jgi:uncharacterized damage-inducible protein DinB